MAYWIVGYALGMAVTAALMAWIVRNDPRDNPRRLAIAGMLVLFWPPWLSLIFGVAAVSFFYGLFKCNPKRKLT